MPQSFDGRLNYRAWDEEPPRWSYLGPFADNQERLTQQALSVAFMTAEEIQENVRPNLAQIQTFRPRFGYPDVQDRQATVQDIIQLPRGIPHPASTWYSGGPAGYTGAPRYENNGLGFT
jgi:hypothetical protein